MTREQLLSRFPARTRVTHRARGKGTVVGVAVMPGGPLVYVTWDTVRDYTSDGEAVAWREAVVPSLIVPLPC